MCDPKLETNVSLVFLGGSLLMGLENTFGARLSTSGFDPPHLREEDDAGESHGT